MPLKILVIPDKFKGTLSAQGAAMAIRRGWSRIRPIDKIQLLPMSDGGDGFGEVLGALLHARAQTINVVDAAHRPCAARWWWDSNKHTAVIESAQVIGLARLPSKRYHPFELDTFGLGQVLKKAVQKGARRSIVGIGGSATNDGGFGVARALGWRFIDRQGELISGWTELIRLARIEPPKKPIRFEQLLVAVDVQNKLLGAKGATQVYGPQKGLRGPRADRAEKCLERLAEVVGREFGRAFHQIPGSGAAGGLGFGLMAFAGAELRAGFELFAGQARLGRRLRAADLVITGEGKIDDSTAMGKGVGQIARACHDLGIPCLALAGTRQSGVSRNQGFEEVHALTDWTTPREAMKRPEYWLENLAAKVAENWSFKLERKIDLSR